MNHDQRVVQYSFKSITPSKVVSPKDSPELKTKKKETHEYYPSFGSNPLQLVKAQLYGFRPE